MSEITVWNQRLSCEWLSPANTDYLRSLPPTMPSVEWVWQEMDRVWQHYGLDNCSPLREQAIPDFYAHPVWLMNGIFTQIDPTSVQHRIAIARRLAELAVKNIADYGGGFGVLAMTLAQTIPDATIVIIEPYPSLVGIQRLKDESRIRFATELDPSGYDAVVAQDVLEHVEDPVLLAHELASAVREDGLALFANCFYPVIQCHLPTTFHLRHTFNWVMQAMGLSHLGVVEGAEHAQIFRRTGSLDLDKARRAERVSRILGPLLNVMREAASRITRVSHR